MKFLLQIIIFTVCVQLITPQCLHDILWVTAYMTEEEYDDDEEQNGYRMRLDDVTAKQSEVVKIQNNKELDVICTELIAKLKHIKYIIVNRTAVSEIDIGAFDQAEELENIEFLDNDIQHIPGGIFNNLTNLKVLSLSSNKINKINENAFDYLPKLTEIDLSVNDIEAINTNWFKGCINLRMINLADNEITVVPSYAFQYVNPFNAISIDLQSNKIRKIQPGAFENLEKIGMLQLRRNKIRQVPDMFAKNLQEGKKICLNKNQITCIEEVVLQKLNIFEEIRINRNPIGPNCILRNKQFLSQNENKYIVEHITEDVVDLKKKLKPYNRRNYYRDRS